MINQEKGIRFARLEDPNYRPRFQVRIVPLPLMIAMIAARTEVELKRVSQYQPPDKDALLNATALLNSCRYSARSARFKTMRGYSHNSHANRRIAQGLLDKESTDEDRHSSLREQIRPIRKTLIDLFYELPVKRGELKRGEQFFHNLAKYSLQRSN